MHRHSIRSSFARRHLLPALACLAWLAAPVQAAPVTIAVIENGQAFETIAREVLDEAYRRAGVALTFKEVPALRALAESAGGQVDGELQRVGGLARSYPHLVQVKVAINWFDVVVLSKNVRFTPAGWESLRPYTIGYHRGILAFQQGTAGMKTDPAPNNNLMMKKLLGGRTDIALMTDVEARQWLVDSKDNTVTILAPPITHIQLYHYLDQRHHLLAQRLENVLKTMEAEGAILAIRNRVLTKAGLN